MYGLTASNLSSSTQSYNTASTAANSALGNFASQAFSAYASSGGGDSDPLYSNMELAPGSTPNNYVETSSFNPQYTSPTSGQYDYGNTYDLPG